MPFNYYPEALTFLNFLKFEKRYSQHTVSSYENDLNQFFQFVLSQYEGPKVSKITSGMVRSWLAEMRSENISAKTLNRKISTLNSFFKFQLKVGAIETSPMSAISTPKISRRLPVFVAEEDMQTLQQHVEFPDTWKGKTDQLILTIFYNTGMRLSELVNLKESQIDPSNQQIKVLGKGNKERIIPVSKQVINDIVNYMNLKRELIDSIQFPNLLLLQNGKPLYSKYVYNVVNQNLSYVTTLEKKSPHVLRHTFATHLTHNGADINAIKELLGHSSLAATQIYTHNSIEKLKDVFKKSHPKA